MCDKQNAAQAIETINVVESMLSRSVQAEQIQPNDYVNACLNLDWAKQNLYKIINRDLFTPRPEDVKERMGMQCTCEKDAIQMPARMFNNRLICLICLGEIKQTAPEVESNGR